MQQETRAQNSALEIQLREVGHLTKQDVDHAQGAELSQRQVTRTLTSTTEGVPAQINDLLADLESNRVDNADVARRMQAMLAEIARLESDHLAPIERELTSAIKGAQVDLADAAAQKQPDRPQSPAVGTALAVVGTNQDEVIRSLEAMLGNLSEWDSYRRFGRDVAQIEREQEEVEKATQQAAGKTLGKDPKDLDPQQLAELKKISGRQSELGRRFDKLLQQMDEARGRLDESDPLAGATLTDALHLTREQGTSGKMRSAGNQVERNQLGQAGRAQEQARKDLGEMLDILANRREHELGRLLKKLRQAEQGLAELHRQHEGLRKKRAELAASEAGGAKGEKTEAQKRQLERLARQQRELQEQIARLSRKLERLQAERAGRQVLPGSAAAKLGREGGGWGKGRRGRAPRSSRTWPIWTWNRPKSSWPSGRKAVEADLARAQLARLQDAIKSLHERQQQARAETGRLEDLRADSRELSRAQSTSVHSLAREQKALEAETRAQAEKLAAAEVFQLALDQPARSATWLAQPPAWTRAKRAKTPSRPSKTPWHAWLHCSKPLKPSNQAGPAQEIGRRWRPKQTRRQHRRHQTSLRAEAPQADAGRPQPQVPATRGHRRPDRACGAADRTRRRAKAAWPTWLSSFPSRSEGNPEDDPEKTARFA